VSADAQPAVTTPGGSRGAGRRSLALGGLAVGAVLALVAGSRAWWRAAGSGVSVAFTGTEASGGLAQALALVALAGALLGLVLRSRGRRVLGVLLVLAGAGVVVLGLTRPRPASGTVRSRVLEVSLADQFALVGTPWPYVYAAAGLLVVAAAGLMALTAGRWPSRAARFERPEPLAPGQAAQPGRPTVQRAPADAGAEEDPASLWRLQDAGVDPTARADGAAGGSPSSERADVHEQPLGVTMKPRVPTRTDEPT
jgi:uncharacterized membrane protein (TIGR02234 family)